MLLARVAHSAWPFTLRRIWWSWGESNPLPVPLYFHFCRRFHPCHDHVHCGPTKALRCSLSKGVAGSVGWRRHRPVFKRPFTAVTDISPMFRVPLFSHFHCATLTTAVRVNPVLSIYFGQEVPPRPFGLPPAPPGGEPRWPEYGTNCMRDGPARAGPTSVQPLAFDTAPLNVSDDGYGTFVSPLCPGFIIAFAKLKSTIFR